LKPRSLKPCCASGSQAPREKGAGKQKFNVQNWVLENVFDKDERKFIECVPDAANLSENLYDLDQEKFVRNGLLGAERTMRSITARGYWSFF
jgi:hypothetical protein